VFALLPPDVEAWLVEQVAPEPYRARGLLPNRCVHAWSPWQPTCEPTAPAAPTQPRVLSLQVGRELTDEQREVLDFEAASAAGVPRPGVKDKAIRDRFGVSPIRYYQLLNRLLDCPAAAAHQPVLVGRLRRLRGRR
jgi:hypothetical protein